MTVACVLHCIGKPQYLEYLKYQVGLKYLIIDRSDFGYLGTDIMARRCEE
jgi:hypothetical protein